MATKIFGELCGVRVYSIKDEFKQSKSYCPSCEKKEDYKIQHQGDPIFIVDYALGIIKTYVAKIITRNGSNSLTIKCSKKGKNQNFIPISEDFYSFKNNPFEGCISIQVNGDSSTFANVATTLDGAIKLLNFHKNKGNFASLSIGDKIYDVNRHNNEITELTIEKVENFKYRAVPTFKIICSDKTEIVLSNKFYDEKASLYGDHSFKFSPKGKWGTSSYHFIFVSKKKAEDFLKERKKAEEKKNIPKKDGIDTKLKDSKGKPLYIGDTVAYVDGSGSSLKISIGKIINNSEKMLKIFDEDAKKSYIEYREAENKMRIEKGLKPYEHDYTDIGIRYIGTNKLLKIKNYD